jgi:hypothetical protein
MVERLNTALEGRYAVERKLGEGDIATSLDYVMPYVEGESLRFLLSVPAASEGSGDVCWHLIDNWTTELAERLGDGND